MTTRTLAKVPHFEGKELAMEVQQRGCKALGASITVASDVMLIGLIQVVKELQDEVRQLKAAHGIKENT